MTILIGSAGDGIMMWKCECDSSALAWRGVDPERCAEDGAALSHPDEARASRHWRAGEPGAVVFDRELDAAVDHLHGHRDAAGAGVPDSVAQALLRDAIDVDGLFAGHHAS